MEWSPSVVHDGYPGHRRHAQVCEKEAVRERIGTKEPEQKRG